MSSEEISGQEESYSYGYGSSTTQLFSRRNADREAAFFLPHVKSGISLLDCGCGPGSITIDLAQAVAPGPVIGIDIGEDQLEGARKLAEDRAVSNIEFQVFFCGPGFAEATVTFVGGGPAVDLLIRGTLDISGDRPKVVIESVQAGNLPTLVPLEGMLAALDDETRTLNLGVNLTSVVFSEQRVTLHGGP